MPSGDWYRYHHLFRELLRAELARAEPDSCRGCSLARPTGVRRTGSRRRRSATRRQAGDVDRVARLVEHCAPPAYQSGRVATAERWLAWLEEHGALERNAAVAVLGALVADVPGRPAEAERLGRGGRTRELRGAPARRQPLDRLLAGPPACPALPRGVARMRADAELALRTLARGSPFRPSAGLLVAIAAWLAGEVDEADDLFADVAEEGLELGAPEAAAVALGERAAIAIGRGPWVAAEEFAERALRSSARRGWRPTPPARSSTRWRRASLSSRRRRASPSVAGSSTDACGCGSPTRCRTSRSRPAWSSPAPTWPSPTSRRRDDAARDRARAAPPTGPRDARGQGRGAALEPEDHARRRPGASTLTEAELRVLPYLATHLSFREIGERLYVRATP